MRIPPELAQTLAAAVEEGSLDAAGRRLHLTQPAVTQRLQSLERIVGQVLLVRSRPVRATAAGERVIRYARQVARLDADASADLGLEPRGRAALPLAVNADSLSTWFLEPLAQLATDLGMTFDLHRDDEDFTADLLAAGTVVGAVTTRADAVPGCTVTALGTMPYRAVASPAFAARWFPGGCTAAELEAAPVVDFDRKDDLQHRWLMARGADPLGPPRHRVPQSSDFARAIVLGLGWGLLPPAQRAPWGPGLVELAGPTIAVPLYWQRWRVHSAALDAVGEAIASAASGALRAPGTAHP